MQVPNVQRSGQTVETSQALNFDNNLPTLPRYEEGTMWEDHLDSDRGRPQLIRAIEGLVRGSQEYNRYRKYLVGELNMGTCAIFGQIGVSETPGVSIELHHYPFSLYDIVEAVLRRREKAREPITTVSVAREVCQLHFENKIGLVPLTKTAHELAHSGELFIDLRNVFGNIRQFAVEYADGLTREHADKLRRLTRLSLNGHGSNMNQELLAVDRSSWSIGQGTVAQQLIGDESDDGTASSDVDNSADAVGSFLDGGDSEVPGTEAGVEETPSGGTEGSSDGESGEES